MRRHLARLALLLFAVGLPLAQFAPAGAADCNTNLIEDACDLDCGVAAGPCDVPGCGSSSDCDANSVPDECDLAAGGAGCAFPRILSGNTTGAADSTFVGPPDDTYFGLGGQIVTFWLDCGFLIDGPGPDLTVYELDGGSAEFSLVSVLVSEDGITYHSVKASEAAAVNIPGDELHGSNSFARSYDLRFTPVRIARYVRLDGNGTGAAGPSTGFDLDAIGFIHRLGLDCDTSGTLDVCEALTDCDVSGIPDSCELGAGIVEDCNTNTVPDTCDIASVTSLDCDADQVPDECQEDCNTNSVPDTCDVATMTSPDCNANIVPDECDLAVTTFSVDSGRLLRIGSGSPQSFTILSAFAAAADVTITVTAKGDFGATNEYLDVDVNGTVVGQVFATGGGQCVETAAPLIVPADTFNSAMGGGNATITVTAPSAVNPAECVESYVSIAVQYDAVIDCNTTATIDFCDIDTGGSDDVNSNGLPDECEIDCNTNSIPDDWDISQGTSPDCNANAVPDECDVADLTSLDCNFNVIPDECEIDCNSNTIPDDCDIVDLTSPDCDGNTVPDECDMAVGATGCAFPLVLSVNPTGADDAMFTGPPDDVFYGLGGQIVTFEFDCGFVSDGAGPDLTVYEVDSGSAEFASVDILVSGDGVTFHSLKASEGAAVNIPGDEAHGSNSFARSYDLSFSPLRLARFVRLDGAGTGAAGASTGFDLDAIGAIHRIGRDCDGSGTLDACEPLTDCDASGIPDLCELGATVVDDCNTNGVPDTCDVASATSLDCDADLVPDECQTDCNTNSVPDTCDIASLTSPDCNVNLTPDECDLAVTVVSEASGRLGRIGSGSSQSLTILSAFPAASDVTVTLTAMGDFGASNEYLDLDLNGTPIGRLFDVGGGSCVETADALVVPAATFNYTVGGGDATITVTAPSAVNPAECAESYVTTVVTHDAIVDCNTTGTLDFCDIDGGSSTDLNVNGIADDCEPDCNSSGAPDDYDIATGFSVDCNNNLVPDECDLDATTSLDCNSDDIPDECPICPTVEVVFVMDTSSSMTDEGAALCSSITQVVADLQADLIDVDASLMGIPAPGAGIFSCLTQSVVGEFGTTVPGTPPPGTEVLGDCPGGNEVASEDWGRATSVVAGVKPWLTDSVRLVVPIADEGPWCGNPVTDPGVDRDSVNHAISVCQANDVIASAITGSGSSASVIGLAQHLADGTGGLVFSSTLPADDLADGIQSVIVEACDEVSDCNNNDVPDECDLTAGTSLDCDFSNVPDECEADCNDNGLHDSCDIAAGTSDDDNLNFVPDECEVIILTLDPTELLWTGVSGAIGYDVVRGGLLDLRNSVPPGDFTAATTDCWANDHPILALAHGGDPASGDGYWFLVRAVLGSGNLTYDVLETSQVEPRDAEIDLSAFACP